MTALPWSHPDADPMADVVAMTHAMVEREGRTPTAEKPFHLWLSPDFYDRCVMADVLDVDQLLIEHHVVVHRGYADARPSPRVQ
jgi:hypothetical protein